MVENQLVTNMESHGTGLIIAYGINSLGGALANSMYIISTTPEPPEEVLGSLHWAMGGDFSIPEEYTLTVRLLFQLPSTRTIQETQLYDMPRRSTKLDLTE